MSGDNASDEIDALIKSRARDSAHTIELLLEFIGYRGVHEDLIAFLTSQPAFTPAIERDAYACVWTVGGPAKARMFFGAGPDAEVKLIKAHPETAAERAKYKPEAELWGVKFTPNKGKEHATKGAQINPQRAIPSVSPGTGKAR